MNVFLPSIVPRTQNSSSVNYLVPLIAIVFTLLTGSLIFSLLGFDPMYSLYTFFISPISSLYGFSELLVKATPLALIAIGLSYCFKNNIYNIGRRSTYNGCNIWWGYNIHNVEDFAVPSYVLAE